MNSLIKPQKIPIGINTLSSIRENDMVYIDKTPLVWQMVQQPARFFLSRPRRFGKSLLVDTFKELFEGNQALFEGLYIHDKWDWSKSYPVIKIDFASGTIQNRAQLDTRIEALLSQNQHRLGIKCPEHFDLSGGLENLILQAREQYGQKVVILVDEYDKPILDNIDSPDQAAEVREGLKNLYSVLKGQDAHIQFIFMTGVTKFSKVSLFSGLNQLKDITLSSDYATICGYTQQDLETSFADNLMCVDWAKLKQWYNGYQFMGEAIYNPYDILLFISEKQSYRNYWFETGNPSFLIKLFQQKSYFLPDLEQIEVSEEILDSFDIEQINPITLLFQSGYLTIKKVYTDLMGELTFVLVIPNREVKMALNNQLIEGYCQIDTEKKILRTELYKLLNDGTITKLPAMLRRLFAGIPWRNFTNNNLPNSEGYYASVLYAFFASLNAIIIPEDISNHGQVDMTIILGKYTYIIEIKLDKKSDYQTQTPNPALQQIQDKAYAQKYDKQDTQVIEVGLIFNQIQRNLVQFDWYQAC